MKSAENRKFVYEFGKFLLDPSEKTLVSAGTLIHLPAKEFETLLMLVENNGRALSKDEMMSRLWHDSFVIESNLAKQISNLRKILNTNGEQYIETLPKHGYRFTADVRLVATEPAAPIILERRTVKRVTFDVEDRVEPERLSLPPVRYRFFRSGWFALVLVVLFGMGLLTWQYGGRFFDSGPPQIDPYAPIRLTDNPNDDTGPNWTKDGRIRFFRLYADKRVESWVMNSDGTEQTRIEMPAGKRIFSWSPDETKILFLKDGDPESWYIANSDGSGERKLPFRSGNWSSDSKYIVYHDRTPADNFDIFLYSVDAGETRNLTNSDYFEADPSFSPDGGRVVFAGTRDGNGEIYSIAIDGSDLRRLTNNPAIDSHPAYSPDGTQILFTSNREKENADVYIMNSDGSGDAIKLTSFDKSDETAGAGCWSRDGTRIAFFSDRNGKDDIYVIRAETVRPRRVVSDDDGDIKSFSSSRDGKSVAYSLAREDKSGELRLFDIPSASKRLIRTTELASVFPEWSPDGVWIAFHDRIDGNSEICLVRPDGRDFQNLTSHQALDVGPAWSPDGKQIAFVTSRGEHINLTQLYVMDANGSSPRAVTPRKGWEGDLGWWPDGRSLVFSCDRTDSKGTGLDICRIDLDGTDESRIGSLQGHDGSPAVSPDGNRIAFTAQADGNTEIYIINSDGYGLVRLTRDASADEWPEWSPDGKRLRFTSDRGGRTAVYEITL